MSTPLDFAAWMWDTGRLWQNGLAAVPVALVVAALCRWAPCRPTTRHLLWLVVLAMLLIPPTWIGARVSGAASDAAAWVGARATGAWTRAEQWVADARAHKSVSPEAKLAIGADKSVVARPEPRPIERPATIPTPEHSERPRTESPGLGLAQAVRAPEPVRQSGADLCLESQALAPLESPETKAVLPWLLKSPTIGPTGDAKLPGGVTAGQPAGDQRPPAPIESHAAPPSISPSTPGPTGGSAQTQPAEGREAMRATRPNEAETRTKSPAILPDLPAPSAPGSSPRSSLKARVLALRDAIVAFPPIPSAVWAGGMAALVLAAGIRTWSQGRVLRRATAAPAEVKRMVAAASATMGLRRPPETWMVRDRISPMVWCGVKSRLLLPEELWAELDEAGRSAVVMHELAHLRRRDHWTCWAELIACTVYWWHPVAWWVRRRLRDEADLCCDAWVTALFPTERRGYAQALLETRKYISQSRWSEPAVGLSAAGGGAKRFARRLTMVMTHRTRPGGSWTGVALATALAAAGMATGPIWACPPDEGAAAVQPAPAAQTTRAAAAARAGQPARAARPVLTPRPARAADPARTGADAMVPASPFAAVAPVAPMAPTAPVAPMTPTPTATVAGSAPAVALFAAAPDQPADRDASTFERHMARRARGADQSEKLEALLEAAGDRLDQLDERLAGLRGLLGTVNAADAPDAEPSEQHECGDDCENECACAPCDTSCAGPCGGEERSAASVTAGGKALVLVVGGDGRVQVYRLDDCRAHEIVSMLDETDGPVVVQQGGRVAVNGADLNALVREKALVAEMRAKAASDAVRAASRERVEARVNLYSRQAEAYRQAAEQARVKAEEMRRKAQEIERKTHEMHQTSPSAPRSERRRIESDLERLSEATEEMREAADEMAGQADDLMDKSRELMDEAAAAAAEAQSEAEEEQSRVDTTDAWWSDMTPEAMEVNTDGMEIEGAAAAEWPTGAMEEVAPVDEPTPDWDETPVGEARP